MGAQARDVPKRLAQNDPLAVALAEREAARKDVIQSFHLLEIAHRRGEPEREALAEEARAKVERLRAASRKVEAARQGKDGALR